MVLAIAAERTGGPEVLRVRDLPLPEPGAGEALVRHRAIGVNFIDTYFRNGLYPWPVERDLVLGSEAAGVIEALGPGVDDLEVGQRVAYTIPNGAYAEARVLEARHLVPLPDAISDEVAAAAMLKGLTARYLLHDTHPVQKGDTVLFHAAAGGVGLIAGQWLASMGVQAIGTAGGPEKCALARAHGYAHVIDYRSEDFVARVREITGARGVSATYDSVGRDTYPGSLEVLQTFGHFISFGQSSGPASGFSLADLARGSLSATRPVLFHYTDNRAWLLKAADDLFAMIGSGKIRIAINQRFPLADAAEAHRALEARKTTGSTVLIP